MSFAHPWVLLLLVLPVLLAVWEWTRKGHALVLPFDHARVRRGNWLRRCVLLANLLPACLLAAAITILAGPQRHANLDRERLVSNIHFCLDVSGSMMSPFGDGSCYDGAMNAINDFTTYRTGDAFGLTIFGNEVLHWVPVTKDLSAIHYATSFLRPETLPPYFGGTQIGKAVRECRKILANSEEGDRLIILVTDGFSADLGGTAVQDIGAELREDNIVMHVIQVGNSAPPDEIYTLSALTGGEVFSAGDPAALQNVFQTIDGMHAAKLKLPKREFADYFKPFVIGGLAITGLYLSTLFGVRFTPW